MSIGNLAEVSARLEEAVANLPGEPTDGHDLYNRYEQIAIAILDCEHMDYRPDALEDYLRLYLQVKQRELLPEDEWE